MVSTAVCIFSIGGNDYASPFYTNSNTTASFRTQQNFVDFVIGNTRRQSKKFAQKVSKRGIQLVVEGKGGLKSMSYATMFFDSLHPTESAAQHFAQLM
ncbi:hypothetical protein CR513_44097, partial [Mucuna pruriens]